MPVLAIQIRILDELENMTDKKGSVVAQRERTCNADARAGNEHQETASAAVLPPWLRYPGRESWRDRRAAYLKAKHEAQKES